QPLSNCFDPSLVTNVVPSSSQSSQLTILLSPMTIQPNHSHYTLINFDQSMSENKMLNNKVELLKIQLTATQEELENY
ncbi:2825_t:CDS:1, partial [Dentiscutata heterogama]